MSLRPTLALKPHVQLKSRSDSPMTTLAQAALVESRTLLHGTREVLIRHGSEVYRLRHTRNDKLILTK